MLEQVGVGLGDREPYAVGQLEPGLLAQRVHAVDEVVDATRADELVVEMEVERNGDAVRGRDRPAVLAVALDEHLLAREVVAGDANAAVLELLEVARLERGPHRAQLLPELRAEQRKVRLDTELARLDVPEGDLAHAELVRDLVRVALRARCALDDERAQRLPELQPRGRARLPSELDHAAELHDLGKHGRIRLDRLRPAGEMNGLRCIRARRGEHPPQMIGEERHQRRDDAHPLDERVPERS